MALQSGRHGLLHVELQIKPNNDMGERVADYAIRLWMRYHLPIRSVVIYLREAPSTPESPFVIPWEENDDSMRYRFDVLRLWDIPQEQVLSSSDYTLWPLAGLMGGATPETTIQVAERLAALPAPQRERSDLVGALVGLAGIREARDTLLDALRRNHMLDELFQESGILQAYAEEIAAKAAAKAAAEAAEKAAAEGRAEGGREMAREMARLALEGRFGALPQDVLAALAAANEATLRSIVGRVATISLDEVRAQLTETEAQ